MIPGLGTLINAAAILVGSAVGVLVGDRLPERTRTVVTDGLGLVVLLVAALSASAVLDEELVGSVGSGPAVLVVLFALLVGGVIGSLLDLERRLESLGGWLRRRPRAPDGGAATRPATRGGARGRAGIR